MRFLPLTLRVLIGLSFGPFPTLFAGEGQADAREQCRTLVSGHYLSYLNDLDVLKNNLTSTSESVFGMKAKRKLAAKQLSLLQSKHEAQKTPAAELDEDLLGLRYQMDSTDEEIRDGEARLATIKDQIADKEKSFKAFKEALKPVFEAVNAKIVNQGAYPITLQYRHPCSKYQQLCPLPLPQSKALLLLSKPLEEAMACDHYANMRE